MIEEIINLNFNLNIAVLHGWQELPDYLPSDLDIALSPKDLTNLEASLLNLCDARLVNLLQHESTCYFFVLAFQEKGQLRFLQVDAAVDYRRNGLVWFSAEELLDGRRRWKDFWVASPGVEFKYLLVKKILKGTVPERSAARLKELVEELGEQSRELAAGLLGNHVGEKVVRWIQRGDWDTFQKHIRELQKVLKRQKLRQDPLNPFRYWLPEMKRIGRRWRHPSGLFVVVLGPDGAGKSTLIDRLEADLSGAFRRTARFHLMPGLFRKKGDGSPVTNPHAKPPRSFLASLLKLVYYFFDYTLGYWLKVRPALVKSTLVLFDRYYDDLLIDPLRYRYGGPMWLARWLSRLIPRPDLWLILDVPEDELLRRKQEVPFEELHRQREAYRRLVSELSNAIILDGSLPPEEVARQAEDAILEYMHERYLFRRGLWFPERRVEKEDRYFSEALGAHLSEKGKPFFHLALPDGRGYLIPLNSRKAAVTGLSLYSPQKTKARLLKSVLTAGFRSGIARRFLPRVNLDLQELEKHLEQVFGEQNLSLAISLGAPGPRHKPVIQVMTQAGKMLGYVKVGWSEISRELVQNEYKVLQMLRYAALNRLHTPEIIWFGEWHNNIMLVTKPLAKKERRTSSASDLLEALASGIFRDLEKINKIDQIFRDSLFWSEIKKRLDIMSGDFSSYQTSLLQNAVSALEQRLGEKKFLFTLCLGDVTPWNAFVNYKGDKGDIYVVDLENARELWLPGWDLFHLVRSSWNSFRWVKERSVITAVERCLKTIDIPKDLIQTLYLAYLLDLYTDWQLAWHIYNQPKSLVAISSFRSLEKEIAFWTAEILN
jgi:thymidylate kinase